MGTAEYTEHGSVKGVVAECIYCREKGVEATREHVLNESFGKFKGALTLRDTVCADCNDYFGRTIDLRLARATPDGLERYMREVTPKEKIEQFRFDAIQVRAAADSGEFAGARLRFEVRDGKMFAVMIPTVMLRFEGSERWEEFSEQEIASGDWRTRAAGRKAVEIKAVSEAKDWDRLRGVVESAGLKATNGRELAMDAGERPDRAFEISFPRNDDEVERVAAKIAFNYLAARMGPAYVLEPAFNPIRRFIRYGERPELPPVHTDAELPYRTGLDPSLRPLVHFVGLVRNPIHGHLLGEVSLFGGIRRVVILSEAHSGDLSALPLAHLYDLGSKRCVELRAHRARPMTETETPPPST